jgi:DNA (cytosine-5)-methyltransferase 1
MTAIRCTSLFSGLGGLDQGFIEEGFEVVFACDLEPGAVQTYRQNLGSEMHELDLDQHDLSSLPDAELMIGGPPCQSFSLVGRRVEADPRGRLVFRFVEAILAKRPLGFVMENVPGIESSRADGHAIVPRIVRRLERAGYHVLPCRLIATDFLVPQRRRRLFLLGLRDIDVEPPDPNRFALTRYGIRRAAFDLSARMAIGDLGSPVKRSELARYRSAPTRFSSLLRSPGETVVSHHELPRMSETDRRLVSHIPPGGNYRDVPDEAATPRILRFKETGGRTTTYGRLHPDRPAFTINTYFRRPNVGCNFHYSEPRLITPREAMRFQALPDRWQLHYTRQDQRNALIGNAVPTFVARAIAMVMAEAIERRGRRRRAGQMAREEDLADAA